MKDRSSSKPVGKSTLDRGYHQIALEMAAQNPEADPIRLKITSDSMQPCLRPGDVVVMSRLKTGVTPQRGDMIVFQQKNSAGSGLPLTHRLIDRSAAGWITKGDFRLLPDAPVNPDAVLGKVIAIRRGERQINLSTPAWRLVCRLLGWIHFLVGSLMASARKLRRTLEGK